VSDSPYQSPSLQSFTTQPGGQERDKLRRVAKYQRWVLIALLANIVTNIFVFALGGQALAVQLAIGGVSFAVVLFGSVSIFLLGKELINPVVAGICAVLIFVPCISLLVLFLINQKATSFLQRNGITVGFMGVDPNRI
jgi:Fe2+ transport system protein B